MNTESLDATTLTVAVAVLDHLDTMYPAALKAVPASARVSLRNTIRSEVRRAIVEDREHQKEEAEVARPLPLTRRQQQVFDFICAYIARENVAPSYDDIATGVGLSKSSAYRVTASIQARGRIRIAPVLSRAIEVLT